MAMTDGERIMLDTNILLTATDESRPDHEAAREIIATSGEKGRGLCVSGQIVREYLVVATRSAKLNGLGLSATHATSNADAFLRFLQLQEESEAASEKLIELCRNYDVQGKRIHDANIVATMLTHGIGILVTLNTRDFASFEEISLLTLRDFESGTNSN